MARAAESAGGLAGMAVEAGEPNQVETVATAASSVVGAEEAMGGHVEEATVVGKSSPRYKSVYRALWRRERHDRISRVKAWFHRL